MLVSQRKAAAPLALTAVICALLTAKTAHRLTAQAFAAQRPSIAPADRRVDYEVKVVDALPPSSSHLEVSLTFPVSLYKTPGDISLQMPVWCPGDYHIQNFGKYTRDLTALMVQDGATGIADKLYVAHPDAETWLVSIPSTPAPRGHIRITYDLPEMPPGYFSENVQMRDHYAFVNGASALLYLTGHKELPATLTVHLKEGWKAETPLPAPTLTPAQNHRLSLDVPALPADMRFAAPDYDTLADSPLVMADQTALRTFDLHTSDPRIFNSQTSDPQTSNPQASGLHTSDPRTTGLNADKAASALYRAVYFGDVERVTNAAAQDDVLMRLARAENRIMGGAPNPRYDFFFEVGGRGGGLEHLNACRLPLRAGSDPQRFAPFVAHEFFHQWNVKRIRPAVLGPFDYIHPPRTRNLWFAEGVTEYYAHIATRRAGLYTPEQFLAHWRRAISRMQHNPARLSVTADQASLDVWEAGRSQGSGGLSYYDKGELIGLCLDLKIRHVTQGRRSLDDVMRALLQKCAPPRPGYGEDELRDTVNTVAGQNLTDFYNLLARSTQEMPFAECLAYVGLDASLMPLPDATPAQTALQTQWTAQDN